MNNNFYRKERKGFAKGANLFFCVHCETFALFAVKSTLYIANNL